MTPSLTRDRSYELRSFPFPYSSLGPRITSNVGSAAGEVSLARDGEGLARLPTSVPIHILNIPSWTTLIPHPTIGRNTLRGASLLKSHIRCIGVFSCVVTSHPGRQPLSRKLLSPIHKFTLTHDMAKSLQMGPVSRMDYDQEAMQPICAFNQLD